MFQSIIASQVDWNFAGEVSAYGFAGVFIAMGTLALFIWLIGKGHAAFDKKLKGKGTTVGFLVILVLAALVAAHVVSENRRASVEPKPLSQVNEAAAKAPAWEGV